MSIEVHSNVFTLNEIDSIYEYVSSKENFRKWVINKNSWPNHITNHSIGIVNILLFEGKIFEKIKNTLQKLLKTGEIIKTIMYYEWNQLSQINWHTDGDHRVSLTVYLNENWEPNWGGFFCSKCSDSETGNFFIPTFNTALITRGNFWHHVSLVNPLAPVRKTLQIFIDKE